MQSTPQHAARVLGLSLEATLEDVRAVRRKMALKYHPDCADDQEQATRHMARINAAADTLTAYLMNKSAFQAKAARARRTASQQARPSARRPEATKRKPAEKTSHNAEAPKVEKVKPATDPVQKYAQSDAAWKAERALARFATESYSRVLQGIGRAEARPTVDVTVLSFAKVA
ncbi:J domain-containing protein [Roseovarius sp. 2305UL8-3]|uniref:J domain-containing protein n=1 Tax=Roseovarius conchicola TaxID=3121636 RepID=UPI0035294C34